MDSIKDYIYNKKNRVNNNIENILLKYNSNKMLLESTNYSVLNNGKRLRPVIMYILADIFDKDYKYIDDIAVAIEFIHTYSLIHDDLPAMDNDMYRRGRLTTHIKYDEATAILTGDALLTEAFNIISNNIYIENDKKIEIIIELSKYIGIEGMIKGQMEDIMAENKKISIESLKDIYYNKTAKLLIATAVSTLIAIDKKDKVNDFIDFFYNIGIAYQIKDDIIEIEEEFENTGKLPSDEKLNKSTFVSILGINKSKEELNIYINKALDFTIDNNYKLLKEFTMFLLERKG